MDACWGDNTDDIGLLSDENVCLRLGRTYSALVETHLAAATTAAIFPPFGLCDDWPDDRAKNDLNVLPPV